MARLFRLRRLRRERRAVKDRRLGGRTQAALVVRRDLEHGRWIWELRTPDGQLLKCSEGDFQTRAECEADAVRHGLTA